MESHFSHTPREKTWLWLLKIILGLGIVVLLMIHFIINHLVAPGGLLFYADIIRYYQNPVVPIMEALFLVFVVVHSLLGIRSIILDLNPGARLLLMVDISLTSLGLSATTYGLWLILWIVGRGV